MNMIRIITYLINKLTEYREYLIDKSIPKSQRVPQQEWLEKHIRPVPTVTEEI